jgi:hypothetical protein
MKQQIQDDPQSPRGLDTKNSTSEHIIVNFWKPKKKKILKGARGEWSYTFKGETMSVMSAFSVGKKNGNQRTI